MASRKFKGTPITTRRSLSLTFDEDEHQSDESHDQPDGSHDQHNGSHDRHNTSRLPPESPVPCSKKASQNTPVTVLLNGHPVDQDIGAVQEDCGKRGSEGGGEREGRNRDGREEDREGDSLLSPGDVFSPTPLEVQSLRTLELMASGSVRAKGYSVWQGYRDKRRLEESDNQVLGSIGNCLRAKSIHERWTEEGERRGRDGERGGERRGNVGGQQSDDEGARQTGGREDGSEPEAFKVKPGDKVLCLDGGGIRGLVQLEILREIEELTHRRIVDLFDWIVGTSTGGILALGMVYADMTCRQLHQLYFEMKERVFKNPWLGLICHTQELEAILKERLGEDTKMTSLPKKPKVLVCAVNKATTHMQLTFFNNCFNDAFSNYPVWKVGRYTAAAPLYFTECDYYVDGGVLANNPCSGALTRIQDYHKEKGGQLSLVVSVGCGQYPAVPLGDTSIHSGVLNMMGNIGKLRNIRQLFITALTGCSEAVSDNCRCRCEQQHPPIQYFRYNSM
ncbi:85/88 kDa calcium-independent phospholipase A2 [Geodia barretti]|uniref:85/88 kDa calcium-independent phospholipase A2 n=1 Tax=Geodia barretti TaxID=519541 RepID=A0AA35WYI5_GEOBA|nr:85/88 kDa calcium-independent phospholipase A2 [Geodia barretti]